MATETRMEEKPIVMDRAMIERLEREREEGAKNVQT